MIRSIRPIIADKRRPHPPQEDDHVTGRSQARHSNMHDVSSHNTTTGLEDEEDQVISSVEDTATEVGVGTEAVGVGTEAVGGK